MPCVPACQRGLRANVLACQRGLRANVPACQGAKSVPSSHFHVPTCHKAWQCFNLACQRAKRRANFSTRRANVPKSMPIFQTFLLRNAKGNFYTLLLYKKFYIVYTYTYHVCVYLTDKLYYTILFETFLLFR